ncbi:MAG: hypothetical protein ACOC38_02610 [Promethearchaeia archaeon]
MSKPKLPLDELYRVRIAEPFSKFLQYDLYWLVIFNIQKKAFETPNISFFSFAIDMALCKE